MADEPKCPFGYEIRQRVSNLEGTQTEVRDKVSDMYDWMVKNGLKDDVEEIKKLRQEQKEWRQFLKRALVRGGISIGFLAVLSIIFYLAGIPPL